MDLNLGENIKAARMSSALTQTQLATMIGVSKSGVSQYESNNNVPSISTMQAIAEATGRPLFWFFMTPDQQAEYEEKKALEDTAESFKDLSELPTDKQDLVLEIAQLIKKYH